VRTTATALLALWATGAAAASPAEVPPPPAPPAGVPPAAAPPAGEEGVDREALERQVIIRPRAGGRIEEYRVNGRLYMVKVKPRKGPPYYLIDSDGDGSLDTRRDELGPDVEVPHWVIIRW